MKAIEPPKPTRVCSHFFRHEPGAPGAPAYTARSLDRRRELEAEHSIRLVGRSVWRFIGVGRVRGALV